VIETTKNAGLQVSVDLDSPDHEFFVEVRDERSFVYNSIVRGVGGLPLGSQGQVVSLMTDYESILATWLVMKRGCIPILAVFDVEEEFEELANAAKVSLMNYALGKLHVLVLPLAEVIEKAGSTSLHRCLEYMTMSEIADSVGAEGIVTPERLELSSSKELEILSDYLKAVHFPVFYPLIGFREEDLNSLAMAIDSELSTLREKIKRQENHAEAANYSISCGIYSSSKEYEGKIRQMVTSALEKERA
jgi:thiamine biosynthesis protein ThiI